MQMVLFYIPSLTPLHADCLNLQTDLSTLQKWSEIWQMEFNSAKCTCEHLQVTNKYNFIDTHYTLYGHTIQKVTNAKYLGITFDCHLSWKSHINTIAAKAYAALAFLWRNITFCPTEVKIHCYKTFVWPIMEYSATAWSPYTALNITKHEKVQCRAARYIFNDYSSFHSVSAMLNQLNWPFLKTRRDYLKVIMLYKINKGLVVDITPTPVLTPIPNVTRGHPFRLRILPSRTNCHLNVFFHANCLKTLGLPPIIHSRN